MYGTLYCRGDNNWWIIDHEHKGTHQKNSLKKNAKAESHGDPPGPPDQPDGDPDGPGDELEVVEQDDDDDGGLDEVDTPLVTCEGFRIDGVNQSFLLNRFYASGRLWVSLSLMGTKGEAKGKSGRKGPPVFFVDQGSELWIKAGFSQG